MGKPTRTVLRGGIGGDADLLPDPIVFLTGLEEGLLPHARALSSSEEGDEDSGLEEERRVFFVGLTRPRYAACLSYCRERRAGDSVRVRRPSRFLDDLPPDLVVRAA